MRVLLIVLPILLVGLIVAVVEMQARRRNAPIGPGRDHSYKNHQDMARWIERMLHDDYIRPTISSAEQERAQQLLGEFYGDPPNELP